MWKSATIVMTALMALSWSSSAQASYDAVTTSPHNLAGPDAPLGDVCLGCHNSNGAGAAPDALAPTPAWSSIAAGNFDVAGSAQEFANTTQTCLHCHDGTTAAGVTRPGAPVKTKNGGSNHPSHPVELAYPRNTSGGFVSAIRIPQQKQFWSVPDIVDGALVLPTGPTSSYQVLSADISAGQYMFQAVRTREGKVECESCHNPHDNTIRPFLRAMPPQLCLVCHDK
jgi:predicted CXXCH cytochrome family protein